MTGIIIDAATVVDLICDFPAADPFRGVIQAATAVAAPAHVDARDALYVAWAASLDATLVTSDGRLRRAATGLVTVAEPVE